jgi:phenylpyruvate tautomerase PptA (4-oxalocrotonate tautomerase family)
VIRIYGLTNRLDPIKADLSKAIHDSMVEVLGMPRGKRAHRFIGLDAGSYFVPEGRSERYTVIEINMMAGRTADTRKALIKTLFRRIEADLGISPIDVEIIITEQPPENWGFRGMTGDEADIDYNLKV